MTAYKAVAEDPDVYCAYGTTPTKAMREMARLLKDHNVDWWSASHVNYIEEDRLFVITIYV